LNYSIKVSVKRLLCCHVRYCFSTSPNNLANNVLLKVLFFS